MMAAGNAPDLSFTYDAVLVGSYVSQGGLADLTSYLNQAPTLKTWTGADALSYGTWGGKVYAIPGKRQILGISGTWIRKDWLDKLKLPLPKTTKEFVNAVRAFRDKDPGKLGDKLVPIGGGFTGGPDINIMYSFYKPSTERDRAGVDRAHEHPARARPRDPGRQGRPQVLQRAAERGADPEGLGAVAEERPAELPGRPRERVRRCVREQRVLPLARTTSSPR